MDTAPAVIKVETAIPAPSNTGFFEHIISWTFWGILSVSLAVYCCQAIFDPDFWWHLKSGEVMLDQRGLLNIDPFNYTGDTTVHRREACILKGYWLWQGMAAILYRFWGFYGIFVLKGVTLLLLIGSILKEMQRQSVSPFFKKLLIALGTVILISNFFLERPQIFSFIFLTVLLGMVARIRLGHRPSWLLLPLMVLWSNIHGGFVVGDLVLAIFAAGAAIQYRNDLARLKVMLCWALAGIVISFVNPTGWNSFIEVFTFSRQNLTSNLSEYMNVWSAFKIDRLIGLLWIIVALHGAGLLLSRKVFWPEILISLFLIVFGLKFFRNVPFIALSMLPMTGWYLDQARHRMNYSLNRFWKAGVLIILSSLLVWQGARELPITKNGWPVNIFYPERMSNFLRDSGFSGHLFNNYNDGGFLAWVLYPKWKTFIDGRGLDYRVHEHYSAIIQGGELHSVLLDQYLVDAVALPVSTDSGRLQPLLASLLRNPRWTPVFFSGNSFVMAKHSEKNDALVKQYGIDKTVFLDRILLFFKEKVNSSPADHRPLTTYTELLICAKKYAEAEAALNRLQRIRPDSRVVPLLRRAIEVTKQNNKYFEKNQ